MLQTQQLKRLQQHQNLMQNQQMQQQQRLHQQAPSPMPGDSDKPVSGISSLLNTGNIVHQPSVVQALAPSLAIGTPGISVSPLLADFTSPDGAHGGALTTVSGKSNVTEQPLEYLIEAVKSPSPKALSASVGDIGSVVSMIDRIAGSAAERERDSRLKAERGGEESTKEENKKNTYRVVKKKIILNPCLIHMVFVIPVRSSVLGV
ncbi:hypothetical protein NC651_007872 [Populus alba x Populus x berolinensis]|nr:hypothetical protein NC651_007872 [Populus alba x Populus x berolinensis]